MPAASGVLPLPFPCFDERHPEPACTVCSLPAEDRADDELLRRFELEGLAFVLSAVQTQYLTEIAIDAICCIQVPVETALRSLRQVAEVARARISDVGPSDYFARHDAFGISGSGSGRFEELIRRVFLPLTILGLTTSPSPGTGTFSRCRSGRIVPAMCLSESGVGGLPAIRRSPS
jgi:hypothetical protein